MTLLEELEADEGLTLNHVKNTLVEQRVFDNRKYQHRLPEIQYISRMGDGMKQAYFIK